VNSRTSKRFRALLATLPADIRKQALKAYRLFEADPNHPGLNFELINSNLGLWSARVNNSYRVLGTRRGADILWIWIGTHAEYEKIIRRQ
jgi:mRNA-degrading endonuclease RelE of RelBE toxin-antitoxin system